jgi:hypothetical protein
MENPSVLTGLERLERENRRLKLSALLLLVMVVGVGAIHQPGPTRTMTANRLELQDANGKTRVVADAASDKAALLTFLNEQGQTRLRVGLFGKEPRVETWDDRTQEWRNFVGGARVFPAR